MNSEPRITFDDVPQETFLAPAGSQDNWQGASPKEALPRSSKELPALDFLRAPRHDHLLEGARRLPVVIEARRQLRASKTLREIGTILGVSCFTWNKWVVRVRHIADDNLITAADLADQTFRNGAKAKHQFAEGEAQAVKQLVARTNRNATSGSLPQALHAARKLGLLSDETYALVSRRFEIGQPALPPAMFNQVRVPELTIQMLRHPRITWIENVQSHGSLYLTRDEVTGQEREIEPGEKWTIDDGTINFVCCVPFKLQGNKCSDAFGVMVGRFQFILIVDHRSHFIPGFNYTARPRSSYRAEDLTAAMHVAFMQHGYPQAMVLEHGVSAAKLVTDTLGMLGVRIQRASSPHEKVVENVFNKTWTKLSLMPGQVGRYMGEEEQINALILSCRNGATDPRKHFPMLADVLAALRTAIVEHNEQWIHSRQYGDWQPQEYFQKSATPWLRRLNPADAWMFAPVITDPLTVRGYTVRKTVPMMEGCSEVFDFNADWLGEFKGALVKLFFNPFTPESPATIVLAQDFEGRKAGTVLGTAPQVNRMTNFRLRAYGYDTPDIGLAAAKSNAQALRRSTVGIRTDGTVGLQVHEARDGQGNASTLATGLQPSGSAAATPMPEPKAPPVKRGILAPPTSDEFKRKRARLAASAAQTRRLNDLVAT